MRLTQDHKVALFDRLRPHLEEAERALRRRVETVYDRPHLEAAGKALQAVASARVQVEALADRPETQPPSGEVTSYWRGRLFVYRGRDGLSAGVVLGRLTLSLGATRHGREALPCLAAAVSASGGRCVGLDAELTVWRLTPWVHASILIVD